MQLTHYDSCRLAPTRIRVTARIWSTHRSQSVAPPERQPVVATKKLSGHDYEISSDRQGTIATSLTLPASSKLEGGPI